MIREFKRKSNLSWSPTWPLWTEDLEQGMEITSPGGSAGLLRMEQSERLYSEFPPNRGNPLILYVEGGIFRVFRRPCDEKNRQRIHELAQGTYDCYVEEDEDGILIEQKLIASARWRRSITETVENLIRAFQRQIIPFRNSLQRLHEEITGEPLDPTEAPFRLEAPWKDSWGSPLLRRFGNGKGILL